MYLDDHQLFRQGFRKACDPHGDRFIFHEFSYPDDALAFLETSYQVGSRVDLIISDINHPGMNGALFAAAAQELAIRYGVQVPLMIVSMVVWQLLTPQMIYQFREEGLIEGIEKEFQPMIEKLLLEPMLTGAIQVCLPKSSTVELILEYMEALSRRDD